MTNDEPRPALPTRLLDALHAVLDDEGLLLDAGERRHYGSDRCKGGWPIRASAVVRPASVAQVQEVVRLCGLHGGVAIVPSGGRTGLTGAAVATAGEVVVSLERMRSILEVDPEGQWIRCEPGVSVEEVQRAAQEVGLCYPVDFAAKGTAQIGGSIATNAGGVRVLRYGSTRAWVRGLKVVLASGELLETGNTLVKDNTGYELRQLFVGSEGTLGIIVEATMGLCPPPESTVVALLALPREEAITPLFRRMRASGLALSAFECFDAPCVRHVCAHRGDAQARGPFDKESPSHVLVEIEVPGGSGDAEDRAARAEAGVDALTLVLADAQDAGEIEDAVVAGTDRQAQALWAWREDISESLHPHTPHKADVSVPVARVVPFMQAWRAAVQRALPDVPAVCFGHVGDGNLHLNLLCPEDLGHDAFLEQVHTFDQEMYALVARFEGSVSAEHGVGLLKRDVLHHSKSPAEVAAMRAIKASLDPEGILNPGKIFE